MNDVHQDVMCALLQTLVDQKLIPQNAFDAARNKVLDTFDKWTFFCYADQNNNEEVQHGST